MRGIYSIIIKVNLNEASLFFHFPHDQVDLQLKNGVFGLYEKLRAVGQKGLAVDKQLFPGVMDNFMIFFNQDVQLDCLLYPKRDPIHLQKHTKHL